MVSLKKYSILYIALLICFSHSSQAQLSVAKKESAFYKISDVPIPEGIVLEVGGMDFDDQGKLGVVSRRGELWTIEKPGSSNPNFVRYAHGMHEPLGLAFRNGSYYLTQRGELSKLTDRNGDGKADSYESIYTWPLAGNYHEYSYGPKFLPNGDMLINLNLGWLGRGVSTSKWRGWMLQITEDGQMTPVATGMRSPAGFGFNKNGDIFYTENQGDWVGSGRMTHIEKGDFVGHPEGLKWSGEKGSPVSLKMEDIKDDEPTTLYDYSKKVQGVKPPSVWFPHTLMGISTSDLVVVPEGFGPFEGQLLVGDQGHSKIMRVYQEKVNGVYQGVCFPFVEGFSSGVLRMVWGPQQTLYVGMTNRGWSSTGRAPFGIQRLNWTEKTPFEIKTVNARPDGFELEFTQPVDKSKAADLSSYKITDFTFKYHRFYGSPPINKENRPIAKVDVSDDGLKARLYIQGLRPGYIYEIKADGLRNRTDQALLHSTGYYTLNEIPPGEKMAMDHSAHSSTTGTTVNLISPKRPTEMPASWTDGPDQSLTIGTLPGLKYDIEEIRVKAGNKVKLVFNNNDDMLHNLLIVKPGQASPIGEMAMQLGLDGEEKGYVPDSDQVLYHTNLLQPHTSDALYFVAPSEPGTYEYVCTFPGHYLIMRGVLVVE